MNYTSHGLMVSIKRTQQLNYGEYNLLFISVYLNYLTKQLLYQTKTYKNLTWLPHWLCQKLVAKMPTTPSKSY